MTSFRSSAKRRTFVTLHVTSKLTAHARSPRNIARPVDLDRSLAHHRQLTCRVDPTRGQGRSTHGLEQSGTRNRVNPLHHLRLVIATRRRHRCTFTTRRLAMVLDHARHRHHPHHRRHHPPAQIIWRDFATLPRHPRRIPTRSRMDRKSSEKHEVERLIQLSAAARSRLTHDAIALRDKLDVPARIRHSLHDKPGFWLTGSIVSGLAASMLFRRKKSARSEKSRGVVGNLLGLTLTAARPLLKIWLGDALKKWLSQRISTSLVSNPATHRPSDSSQTLSNKPHVHPSGPRSC